MEESKSKNAINDITNCKPLAIILWDVDCAFSWNISNFLDFIKSLRKKKSKSKTKEREEQALSNEASGSGSAEKKNKNQVDAEKYYQNKTKSEIAFLKKKEESVSYHLSTHKYKMWR